MAGRFGADVETPYTVSEVAALMGLSRQTVIRLFEREPGVLIIKYPEKMHKRGRRTIRIPRDVFERVIRSLRVK
jgi:transcriptional regulator GlxA family with amidase domain